MEDKKISGVLDDKYHLLHKVGEGGTSKVYLGYEINCSEEILYAVKIMNSKDHNSKFFANEVEMLKKIDHPNVIRIIDGAEGILKKSNGKNKFVCYIVLEYLKCGELFDFIFFPQSGFGEKYARQIFKSILDSLQACHNVGIVHRDLKNENIMVTEKFEIKLADFGFAAFKEGKDGKGLLYTSLGTANYVAPELHNRVPYYGESNDIFSAAVTLFVLTTGTMPFKMASKSDPLYSFIIKNDFETYLHKRALNTKLSDRFLSLFFNMIAYDHTKRLSIDEIRQHPWMQDLSMNTIEPNNDLVEEFKKRQKIIETKKTKEKLQKLQEKNSSKIQMNRVYRSDKHIIMDNNFDRVKRELKAYVDYGNKYVVSVSHINNIHSLFDYIQTYFIEAKTETYQTKYSIKIVMPMEIEDELSYFENEQENCSNLILIEDLKLKVEIKTCNDYYIVEFTKCSGDRLKFFHVFQNFVDSLN